MIGYIGLFNLLCHRWPLQRQPQQTSPLSTVTPQHPWNQASNGKKKKFHRHFIRETFGRETDNHNEKSSGTGGGWCACAVSPLQPGASTGCLSYCSHPASPCSTWCTGGGSCRVRPPPCQNPMWRARTYHQQKRPRAEILFKLVVCTPSGCPFHAHPDSRLPCFYTWCILHRCPEQLYS